MVKLHQKLIVDVINLHVFILDYDYRLVYVVEDVFEFLVIFYAQIHVFNNFENVSS